MGAELGSTMASIKDNIENVAVSFLNHLRSRTVLSPATTGISARHGLTGSKSLPQSVHTVRSSSISTVAADQILAGLL